MAQPYPRAEASLVVDGLAAPASLLICVTLTLKSHHAIVLIQIALLKCASFASTSYTESESDHQDQNMQSNRPKGLDRSQTQATYPLYFGPRVSRCLQGSRLPRQSQMRIAQVGKGQHRLQPPSTCSSGWKSRGARQAGSCQQSRSRAMPKARLGQGPAEGKKPSQIKSECFDGSLVYAVDRCTSTTVLG